MDPNITATAKNWLERFLSSDMTAFEWGSGGSTLYISSRVARLISIEHDPQWWQDIKAKLQQQNITNCEIILRPPEQHIDEYTSVRFPELSFEKYVKAIDEYPDEYFDFVFVDGRARCACIKHALAKVKAGGVLMLDDTERQRYLSATALLANWEASNFSIPLPASAGLLEDAKEPIRGTCIWKKPAGIRQIWQVAQAGEKAWWDTCQNTYNEEQKQLSCAKAMGLQLSPTSKTPVSFDMQGKSVLDVGGGPVSLLLKCRNVTGKVVDPLILPAWVEARYSEAGIDYERIKAEDMNESGWDEVWIYNVLAHTENPEEVVKKALAAGSTLRINDWVDHRTQGPDPLHPHNVRSADLDRWLGGEGTVTQHDSCSTYSGVFSTSPPVHFILSGGGLTYLYYLAILSALKTQKTDKFILWAFGEPEGEYWPLLRDRVKLHIVLRPHIASVADTESTAWREHAKNLMQWKILYDHGGLFLDLDTFSLADAIYLLKATDKELVLPHEITETDLQTHLPFFNNAIVLAKPKSPLLKQVFEKADEAKEWNQLHRGALSVILTSVARDNLDQIETVEYGVLGGGGSARIVFRLLEEQAELWPEAKILHLFANELEFSALTEAKLRDSNMLFARIVKNTLEPHEWSPRLTALAALPDSTVHQVKTPEAPLEALKKQKRFHLLGLPHIPTNKVEGLACAYSQKAIKLAAMLKSLGHHVFFYGVEDSDVECDEFIQVSTRDILRQAYGDYDWYAETFRHDVNDIAYTTFHANAIKEIAARMTETDFLLFPWNGHKRIFDALSTNVINDPGKLYLCVESGIGYDFTFTMFRVFESYNWMSYVYGLQKQKDGRNYDAVIPNYFDPDDFEYCEDKDDYFLYLGRVILRKGVHLAKETVDTIGGKLLIAGQDGRETVNDGKQYLDTLIDSPNVEYVGFADLEKRRQLLAHAKALFVPTQYIGPFEGVSIEAAFSGTPVITTDWGCFAENVLHGTTGYRCRTKDHFVWAARNIDRIRPADCYKWAMDNFSLERVRWMYEEYFNMLSDIKSGKGWYEIHPERTELDWLHRKPGVWRG